MRNRLLVTKNTIRTFAIHPFGRKIQKTKCIFGRISVHHVRHFRCVITYTSITKIEYRSVRLDTCVVIARLWRSNVKSFVYNLSSCLLKFINPFRGAIELEIISNCTYQSFALSLAVILLKKSFSGYELSIGQ